MYWVKKDHQHNKCLLNLFYCDKYGVLQEIKLFGLVELMVFLNPLYTHAHITRVSG